jgi:hypothetical protein
VVTQPVQRGGGDVGGVTEAGEPVAQRRSGEPVSVAGVGAEQPGSERDLGVTLLPGVVQHVPQPGGSGTEGEHPARDRTWVW